MKIDTIKGLATYGTAAIVVLLSLVVVALLTFGGQIDGATGIGFFASVAGAAAGFLFASEVARARQGAYQAGLDTPTPPEKPASIIPVDPQHQGSEHGPTRLQP